MIGFPLLLVPFAIYNMIALLISMDWATKLYRIPLKIDGYHIPWAKSTIK